MTLPRGWKPAPKPGYVVCPYCFAVVEDKGLVIARHVTSKECQSYQGAPTDRGSR